APWGRGGATCARGLWSKRLRSAFSAVSSALRSASPPRSASRSTSAGRPASRRRLSCWLLASPRALASSSAGTRRARPRGSIQSNRCDTSKSRVGRVRQVRRVGRVSKQTHNFMSLLVVSGRLAVRALNRNKLRTFLTMLGMIIGVAAVVTMVALGNGAQHSVEKDVRSAGTGLIQVKAGNYTRGGEESNIPTGLGSAMTLSVTDAEAIAREVSGIKAVAAG